MGKRWFKICLVVLLLLLFATGSGFCLEEMYVYYIDTGQAESTLLKSPDFTILIDAGDQGKNDVIDHLDKYDVEVIDLFILTHPHADHIGQASKVLKNFTVTEVWMSGFEHYTKLFEDLLDSILASDADYWEPRTGEVFDFGDLKLEVLNPAYIGTNLHATNIVVRALYGDCAFLFTGDAEKRTENELLNSGREIKAQILSLGHHGSRTSSSLEFLVAVNPEVAIYSAGINNIYDHPHEEVTDRFKILELPLYGTELNGTIIVRTDGISYEIYSETGESLIETTGQHVKWLDDGARVELNTASLEELQRILHIGPRRAQEIIELREKLSLKNIDDLKWISGLSTQRIKEIKQQGLAYIKGVNEDQ